MGNLKGWTGALALALAACAPTIDDGAPRDGGAVDGAIDAVGLKLASLKVSPASATIEVADLNNLPALQLTAVATYEGGAAGAVAASWTLDRYDIASVGGGNGLLTAGGGAFGAVKVTATFEGLNAQADVTIRLHAVIDDGVVPAGDRPTLDAAAATDAQVAGLLYPYDKTVFPRALLAPELMWRGGADGDSYRLRFTASNYDLTVYAKAPNPSRYTMSQALWNALGASANGGAVSVELRRLGAGGAFISASQTWTVANANLRGTIYYWAIDQGQIVKLDVSSGTRSPTFDAGPNTALGTPVPTNAGAPASPPWEDNGGGKRCVACHAVSKDGSRLSSVFTRASSQGPLGLVSLAGPTVNAISDYQSNVIYTALVPDGSLAVANLATKTMKLLDAATGLPVTSALDALANVCDPAFSPDGQRFAVAGNCDPGFGYPVEYRRADLVLYDFAQASRTFSNARTVRASTGIGDAIAFPSFSPDSSFLFYQRGSYARAKYGDTAMGQYLHGADDLYVSPASVGAASIALDKANGAGVLPADSLHLNYAPTVNPVAAGGFIWVVFTSPRDYGNRMLSPQQAAPQDATYSNRKQLWVTAVDVNVGAADPSHPAFWLPGQDLTTTNMFGYWSLSPCKPTGTTGAPATCSAGFECCSGFCRDSGSGPICVDSPTGCHQEGEKCTVDADCCGQGSGVACVAGLCQGVIQ